MQKKYLDDAKKAKQELIVLMKTTKNKELKNNCVKQIIDVSQKFTLPKQKEEKELYCKHCKKCYDNKTKIRIMKIKKNKENILQKIIICGNCGKKQTIKL